MKITKARVRQIIQEELDRTDEGFFDRLTKVPDASERFPHGDLYDVWVGVGDEIKTVNETFFGKILEDYNYVLNLLKDADDPNGALWQEDTEDSGYAPDLRFPKLTSNQQDVVGTIGRIKKKIDHLIRITPAGDESYNDDAAWKMLSDHKLFDFVSQWVKELEKPVDYTGMP